MASGIRDKVVILGMGCTQFGERWDSSSDMLMVEAFAEADERAAAYRRITQRFAGLLEELVGELPELRRPATAAARPFRGSTARRSQSESLGLDAAAPRPRHARFRRRA